MPAAALDLRYLFGVRFADGQEYWQTEDDRSADCPETRPASYDLKQRMADGEFICGPDGLILLRDDIEMFCLEGQGARYVVDLRDGSFHVQSSVTRKAMAPFFVKIPPKGKKLQARFFLRRRQHATATATANGDGTATLSALKDAGQECEYHFGWQYIENGKVEACTLILI